MFKRNLAILTIAGLSCGFLVPTLSYADSQTKEELPQAYNVKSDKDLKDVLKNVSDEYKIKDNSDQYELVKKEKDDLGFTHYTLKPKVDGYFAQSAEVKIHTDKTGKVVFVNGDLNQGKLEVKNETKIDKEKAIEIAFKAIEKSRDEVKNLSGKDVVQEAKIAVDEKSNRAIYSLDISYTLPEAAHWIIKVDAENGNIIEKQNVLEEATQATGSGIGTDGKVKNLNVTFDNDKYVLLDTTHKGKIGTLGFESFEGSADSWILGSLISNIQRFFDQDKAAVDAHYFTNEVYNYYKDVHNRESYDGNGADINSYVHVTDPNYGGNWSNAAWTGIEMIYGDGNPATQNSFTAANDVIAHEITHGVTSSSAGLDYEFQPGALNESFSDVFGYFVDSEDWTMGEDLFKTPGKVIRDLQNPEKCEQPAHMKDYKYMLSDHGGVHKNSGIPNKAAYNTITKIGKEKAEKIYYRALTQYLTRQSQFSDAKSSLIQSAKDLYGDKEANDVKIAWDEVGVK
ncbi:zinc metalloproteinase aureolysin [Paraclostridium ghonii]|uniref:Neutral metalloproteinase n=1 Tax=Paraclostridium ghonii TaxID=29358 RepID=A0ABU0N2G9_9FIRM|nr:M4 family metallopeptidase [Paeniclostridium ghonii]MDQ0557154.1 Zn-dependent metalloprotease [Paeniclostridium ghonii]